MAGPKMKPTVWNSEYSATCVVRSSVVVTFEMYARDAAWMAASAKPKIKG
jgi:hypothetical protein